MIRATTAMLAIALFSSCAETPPRPRTWSEQTTIVGTCETNGDVVILTTCVSQTRLTIVREGAFKLLQEALAATPQDSVTPAIVSFVGRTRPDDTASKGMPSLELVVDDCLSIWPEESCLKAGVETPLDNTYWKLVELNGVAVVIHEGQLCEPYMILRSHSNQVKGCGACNGFGAMYEREGTGLRIHGLAATEIACGYVEEDQFFAALPRVTNYEILGESLILRDDKGPVARLRAVYFR